MKGYRGLLAALAVVLSLVIAPLAQAAPPEEVFGGPGLIQGYTLSQILPIRKKKHLPHQICSLDPCFNCRLPHL